MGYGQVTQITKTAWPAKVSPTVQVIGPYGGDVTYLCIKSMPALGADMQDLAEGLDMDSTRGKDGTRSHLRKPREVTN